MAFDLVCVNVAVFFEKLARGGAESRAYGIGIPWHIFVSRANLRPGMWDISMRHDECRTSLRPCLLLLCI
jgi:hypothetical protein